MWKGDSMKTDQKLNFKKLCVGFADLRDESFLI